MQKSVPSKFFGWGGPPKRKGFMTLSMGSIPQTSGSQETNPSLPGLTKNFRGWAPSVRPSKKCEGSNSTHGAGEVGGMGGVDSAQRKET